MEKDVVIVRGGGDIASGTIQKLYRSGFRVLVLEIENPTFIRRDVSFGEAVYLERVSVEGIEAVRVNSIDEIQGAWNEDKIPVMVDPDGNIIKVIKPLVLVDAILAKRNLGTAIDMADITIALGPGFEAGRDVDVVIETMRGHDLGRLIFNGQAKKNTGVPGNIMGFSTERVIYSPRDGIIKNHREIGDFVEKGEVIAEVDNFNIEATINGILRGIIKDGFHVKKNLKIADIDPRKTEIENCCKISDKARNIAGGVLEAILYLRNKTDRS